MKYLLSIILMGVAVNSCIAQNKVTGLELPPDSVVENNKNPIIIEAKCTGLVKWFVSSTKKTTYKLNEAKKTIEINTPDSGFIQIAAIGITEQGTTDFASTKVTIKNSQLPLPIAPAKKNSVLIFTNFSKLSNDQLTIYDNLYQNSKISFIVNDVSSPLLSQPKYNEIYQNLGSNTLLIVEDGEGKVIFSSPVPSTKKEIDELVFKYSN